MSRILSFLLVLISVIVLARNAHCHQPAGVYDPNYPGQLNADDVCDEHPAGQYTRDSELKLVDEAGGVYRTTMPELTETQPGAGNRTWNKRDISLSINNPVDVLRKRILLEIARCNTKRNQWQIDQNRHIMDKVGKR